jgi:hypothetical protein
MRNAKFYVLFGALVSLVTLISLIVAYPLSASTVGKLIDPDPLSASTG